MKKILLAFQFLTIIPVQDAGEVSDEEMGRTSAVFPFVGLAEGIVLLLFAQLSLKVLPSELTNVLLVLVLIIMNGGLHLDGLSDTCDALASRGSREKKLLIMKDSTIGPFGVIAIVMALLLKYALLNAVFFQSSRPVYFLTVMLMPVMSRWAMVPLAYYGVSARNDGLGRLFLEHTEKKELISATVTACVIILIACASGSEMPMMIFYLMFAMPLLYAFGFGAAAFFMKMFEGMTGDSFGAVHEIALLLFLLMVIINSAKVS